MADREHTSSPENEQPDDEEVKTIVANLVLEYLLRESPGAAERLRGDSKHIKEPNGTGKRSLEKLVASQLRNQRAIEKLSEEIKRANKILESTSSSAPSHEDSQRPSTSGIGSTSAARPKGPSASTGNKVSPEAPQKPSSSASRRSEPPDQTTQKQKPPTSGTHKTAHGVSQRPCSSGIVSSSSVSNTPHDEPNGSPVVRNRRKEKTKTSHVADTSEAFGSDAESEVLDDDAMLALTVEMEQKAREEEERPKKNKNEGTPSKKARLKHRSSSKRRHREEEETKEQREERERKEAEERRQREEIERRVAEYQATDCGRIPIVRAPTCGYFMEVLKKSQSNSERNSNREPQATPERKPTSKSITLAPSTSSPTSPQPSTSRNSSDNSNRKKRRHPREDELNDKKPCMTPVALPFMQPNKSLTSFSIPKKKPTSNGTSAQNSPAQKDQNLRSNERSSRLPGPDSLRGVRSAFQNSPNSVQNDRSRLQNGRSRDNERQSRVPDAATPDSSTSKDRESNRRSNGKRRGDSPASSKGREVQKSSEPNEVALDEVYENISPEYVDMAIPSAEEDSTPTSESVSDGSSEETSPMDTSRNRVRCLTAEETDLFKKLRAEVAANEKFLGLPPIQVSPLLPPSLPPALPPLDALSFSPISAPQTTRKKSRWDSDLSSAKRRGSRPGSPHTSQVVCPRRPLLGKEERLTLVKKLHGTYKK